jgi:hypothetical protein
MEILSQVAKSRSRECCDFPEKIQRNCPSGKSLIAPKIPLSSLLSPSSQNKVVHPDGKIKSTTPAVSPGKRGVGHRHERGMGCDGRGSVGAQAGRRAVFRERCAAHRRTTLLRTAKPCGSGIRC